MRDLPFGMNAGIRPAPTRYFYFFLKKFFERRFQLALNGPEFFLLLETKEMCAVVLKR